MVPDGGHNVAEVQGSDGATFVLIFLSECLASMLQLQLLEEHTRGGKVKPSDDKQELRVCYCDEGHHIMNEQ